MLEKLREWDYSRPLLLWSGLYIACFIGAIALMAVIIISRPGLVIDSENAKNAISTLIQIQATIIAVVISLTLLAVEMTASTYSSRVIEVFKKHPNMWFFLISYIISIAIGLFFITFIDTQSFSIDIQEGTLTLLSLGLFLILMLIPYIVTSLDFLNAENIMKRLSRFIDAETIMPEVDPFQSVFDVIYGAIKNYDFTTMSEGLVLIESRFKEIIIQNPPNFDKQYIVFRFFDDLKRCGFLLLERNEEKYTFEVVTRLRTISEWAIEQQDTIVLGQVIIAIEEVGLKAEEARLTSPAHHAITTLKELGIKIEKIPGIHNKQDIIGKLSQIVDSLGNFAERSIKNQHDKTAKFAIEAIENLFRTNIDYNIQFGNDPFSENLTNIARICIEIDNPLMLKRVISSLKSLGLISVSRNQINETKEILDILKRIGKQSGQKWYDNQLKQNEILRDIEFTLGSIAYDANQHNNEKGVTLAISYITDLHILFPKGFTIFSSGLGERVQVKQIEYDIEYQKIYEYIFPGEEFPDDDEGFEENYEDREIVVD